MSDETATLDFLAQRSKQLNEQIADMKADTAVLLAMMQRLDATVNASINGLALGAQERSTTTPR